MARNERDFAEKVTVVSGGSRGLGAALVRDLLEAGHAVATFSRSGSESLDALSAERSGRLYQARVDVQDRVAVSAFLAEASRRLGPITGLVNNAGLLKEEFLARQAPDEIEEVLAVNLKGPLLLAKEVARGMMQRGSGAIVNISSVAALSAFRGAVAYSAAKGGMNAMTRTLARELGARGIRVNAVAPGFLDTDMVGHLGEEMRAKVRRRTPLGRLGHPRDVCSLVLFLLSDEAAFVTGQIIAVDGGFSL